MGKKNRTAKRDFFTDHFWETDNYNFRTYQMYFDMLLSLAMNRFRWVNLPDTCDARYLELVLHRNGIATISHDVETPDVWTSLQAVITGDYSMYGYPLKWRAFGYNGLTNYECTNENGVLGYYNYSRTSPWNALEIFARKMSHYARTEDVNLSQQMKPFIGIAPQEKRQELVNLLKQVEGGEPAILGDNGLQNLVNNVTVLDTKVPFIAEELARGQTNVLYSALLYLGIPHLAFEKGERMIEDEARANSAATNIMLLDCLQARREMCKLARERFGLDIEVYFNDDWESYNFNYVNNVESMAQDKLILSQDETFTGLVGGVE